MSPWSHREACGCGRSSGGGVYRTIFRTDHTPSAFGLHATQCRHHAWPQPTQTGTVRNLIKSVLRSYRTDFQRLEKKCRIADRACSPAFSVEFSLTQIFELLVDQRNHTGAIKRSIVTPVYHGHGQGAKSTQTAGILNRIVWRPGQPMWSVIQHITGKQTPGCSLPKRNTSRRAAGNVHDLKTATTKI